MSNVPGLLGIGAGKFVEACYSLTVKFPLVDAVGLAAMNRRKPLFSVRFSGSIGWSIEQLRCSQIANL